MATSVISANEAMRYFHDIINKAPVILSTVAVLFLFATLTIMGIKESARVATGIFIFHLTSLTVLSLFIGAYLIRNGFSQFTANWNLPVEGSITVAIFFGFSASMLGISGFESSANFVEEQRRGVFPKTLKNMWIIVSIINPLMAFFALSILPVAEIRAEHSDTLLSHMGLISSGHWLSTLVSIDAVLVLSGAVLTSYVGVTGLLERMTLDRILPQFFLRKNKKGSSYRIIIMFFLLSISVLFITRGNVVRLAGVYTVSFLSVMLLFGFGNILLKVRREKLPRPESAKWLSVLTAITAVLIALLGNITMRSEDGTQSNFRLFLTYFIPAGLIVAFMLRRVAILRGTLRVIYHIFNLTQDGFFKLSSRLNNLINTINAQQFVYFTKRYNIAVLNKVLLYIKNNENTRNLKIVHVDDPTQVVDCENSKSFQEVVEIINEEYPEIEVTGHIVKGVFSPALVKELSRKWKIPVNFMFIASPGDYFPFRVEELGGVRLII
jgi:amino acid transporter